MKSVKAGWAAVAALAAMSTVVSARAEPLKNIVLVHGAWVDGSDWKPVYDHLSAARAGGMITEAARVQTAAAPQASKGERKAQK